MKNKKTRRRNNRFDVKGGKHCKKKYFTTPFSPKTEQARQIVKYWRKIHRTINISTNHEMLKRINPYHDKNQNYNKETIRQKINKQMTI